MCFNSSGWKKYCLNVNWKVQQRHTPHEVPPGAFPQATWLSRKQASVLPEGDLKFQSPNSGGAPRALLLLIRCLAVQQIAASGLEPNWSRSVMLLTCTTKRQGEPFGMGEATAGAGLEWVRRSNIQNTPPQIDPFSSKYGDLFGHLPVDFSLNVLGGDLPKDCPAEHPVSLILLFFEVGQVSPSPIQPNNPYPCRPLSHARRHQAAAGQGVPSASQFVCSVGPLHTIA